MPFITACLINRPQGKLSCAMEPLGEAVGPFRYQLPDRMNLACGRVLFGAWRALILDIFTPSYAPFVLLIKLDTRVLISGVYSFVNAALHLVIFVSDRLGYGENQIHYCQLNLGVWFLCNRHHQGLLILCERYYYFYYYYHYYYY